MSSSKDFVRRFRALFLRHDPARFAVMLPQNADRKYNDYQGKLTDAQIAAHLAGGEMVGPGRQPLVDGSNARWHQVQ